MKFNKLYLLFLFTILLISCDKDVDELENNETNIAELVSIVDIQTRIDNYSGNLPNLNRGPGDPGFLIIVTWDEWGRKKRNCDGWGLCNAQWFPGRQEDLNNTSKAAPLDYDISNDKYFIDILFAQEIPDGVSVEDLTLAIDESFNVWVGEEIQRDLTFDENLYEFNSTLGDFGGIRIYLD